MPKPSVSFENLTKRITHFLLCPQTNLPFEGKSHDMRSVWNKLKLINDNFILWGGEGFHNNKWEQDSTGR